MILAGGLGLMIGVPLAIAPAPPGAEYRQRHEEHDDPRPYPRLPPGQDATPAPLSSRRRSQIGRRQGAVQRLPAFQAEYGPRAVRGCTVRTTEGHRRNPHYTLAG